jgi:hypothetical protein
MEVAVVLDERRGVGDQELAQGGVDRGWRDIRVEPVKRGLQAAAEDDVTIAGSLARRFVRGDVGAEGLFVAELREVQER